MHGRLARVVVGAVLGALLALSWESSSQALTLPAGFAEQTVVTGLTQPTAVRFASDGRVFVAEKSGLIKVHGDVQQALTAAPPSRRHARVRRFQTDHGVQGWRIAGRVNP